MPKEKYVADKPDIAQFKGTIQCPYTTKSGYTARTTYNKTQRTIIMKFFGNFNLTIANIALI